MTFRFLATSALALAASLSAPAAAQMHMPGMNMPAPAKPKAKSPGGRARALSPGSTPDGELDPQKPYGTILLQEMEAGVKELERPARGLLISGLSAGLDAGFSLLLMAALGGIALVLAAVGIYGVIAYSVSQRTREFGIRLALGEEPGHTRRSVVLGGMRLVGVSMALGLTAALALARLLRGQLYQVAPGDPLTFSGIAALLALVALLACYIPARRATRVDPALALRSE